MRTTLPGSVDLPRYPRDRKRIPWMTVWPVELMQFLTTWPMAQPQPFVSTLNAYTGGWWPTPVIVPQQARNFTLPARSCSVPAASQAYALT